MDRLDFEVKFDAVGEAGIFEGYASIFDGPPDSYGDVIAPGAFARSLADHKAKGTMPALLWQHFTDEPIGIWQSIVEDQKGLAVKGRLVLDTTRGREAHALMKAGAMNGLSIGFRVRSSKPVKGGNRRLTQIDLVEISTVTLPADAGARVTQIKGDNMDDEDLDQGVHALVIPDELNERLDGLETELKAQTERADKLETKLNRPAVRTQPSQSGDDLKVKAFEGFIRRGRELLQPDEVKALALSPDTAGGYLAHDQFIAEMIKNLVLFSQIRTLARVSGIGTSTALLPKRTGTLTASWVGEGSAKSSTEPTYDQSPIAVHEAGCYVDVSNQLLEDSEFDIASELARDFAEEFGRLEGVAFVNGTGTGQPAGFMQDGGIASINSGAAASVTPDSLIDLYHALPSAYAMNAVWGMNRTTMGAIRKIKTSDGHYLWHEPVSEGNPPTILGRPVVEMADMPDVAAAAEPIVFGDFQAGYRIFDRLQLGVLRDPYSRQVNGEVRFHARRRVGAGVTKSEAFKKMVVAA